MLSREARLSLISEHQHLICFLHSGLGRRSPHPAQRTRCYRDRSLFRYSIAMVLFDLTSAIEAHDTYSSSVLSKILLSCCVSLTRSAACARLAIKEGSHVRITLFVFIYLYIPFVALRKQEWVEVIVPISWTIKGGRRFHRPAPRPRSACFCLI